MIFNTPREFLDDPFNRGGFSIDLFTCKRKKPLAGKPAGFGCAVWNNVPHEYDHGFWSYNYHLELANLFRPYCKDHPVVHWCRSSWTWTVSAKLHPRYGDDLGWSYYWNLPQRMDPLWLLWEFADSAIKMINRNDEEDEHPDESKKNK